MIEFKMKSIIVTLLCQLKWSELQVLLLDMSLPDAGGTVSAQLKVSEL